MTKPLRVDFSDISHWQETVDLAKAKDAGLKAICLKATQGTDYVDARYAERREQAHAIDLTVGSFAFLEPDVGTAYAQVDHFLETVQPRPGEFTAIDVEWNKNGMTMDEMTTFCRQAARRIRRETGVSPLLYTPFALGKVSDCYLWRARYNPDNRPPVLAHDIVQFSNGKDGVPNSFTGLGHVDLDTIVKPGLKIADFDIPEAVVEPARIRIQLAATQFSDTTAQFRHDIPIILARDSHVVVFTEVLKRGNDLIELCAAAGYTYFDPDPESDTGFALKSDLRCLSVGSVPVVDMGGKTRSIEILRFEFAGDAVTVCGGHWLTGYGRSERRRKAGLAMWQAMVNAVTEGGTDYGLAFWAGDVNWDPDDRSDNQPRSVMDDGRLTTVYEELGKPDLGTHRGGRQIDLIGSYDMDGRVSAAWVKVWDDAAQPTFMDHAQVVAAYDILPRSV